MSTITPNHTGYCSSKLLAILALFIICSSCKIIPFTREQKKVEEISSISPNHKYIKAHMKNGQVYILYNWHFDSVANSMSGHGSQLDINRSVIESRGNLVKTTIDDKISPFVISLSDVALIETNDAGPSLAGRMAIVTAVTAGLGVYCIADPKACFGSCPTFYASNGDTLALQAEGFSTSIAPSLEKNDIDMFYDVHPTKDFEVTVTNEALETHAIRYMNLLAFEKEKNERVFAGIDGKFYTCDKISTATQGSNAATFIAKVDRFDGNEYYSLSDPDNLDSKEEIYLSFEVDEAQQSGLVIAKRQTLLTTYLMYQGLAYMGNTASYWLAQLGKEEIRSKLNLFEMLGGIEIYIKDEKGEWKMQGKVHETGPIATDVHIIPLAGTLKGKIDMKIRMNKGLWRIDYLSLARMKGEAKPTVLFPQEVKVTRGSESRPLEKLLAADDYLVTYPGDEYKVKYKLPSVDVELFLDSKGYYLEWMRDEWVKEQNLRKLNQFINKPALYLKKAAKEYKKLEPGMEKVFWESRYEQSKK